MTVQRIAFGLLAALALLFSVNLVTGADRFADAYRAYDELGLELTTFEYASPDEPVLVEMAVTNPTDQTLDVQALELSLDLGVRRVGGGSIHLRPPSSFPRGHSETYQIELNIDDDDYVQRYAGDMPVWQVSGRIQVVLGTGIEPVWIYFTVRQLPE